MARCQGKGPRSSAEAQAVWAGRTEKSISQVSIPSILVRETEGRRPLRGIGDWERGSQVDRVDLGDGRRHQAKNRR